MPSDGAVDDGRKQLDEVAPARVPAADVEGERRRERHERVRAIQGEVAREPYGGVAIVVTSAGRVEKRRRDARGERSDRIGRRLRVLAPDLEQPALAEYEELLRRERDEDEAEDAEADVRQVRAVDLRSQTLRRIDDAP